MSSYSRGFHFAINCWQSIVVRCLVLGPTPCPEVVVVFYIRPTKVPTLSSVKGDAQVEQQNTVVRFLTVAATVKKQPSQDILHGDAAEEKLSLACLVSSYTLPHQNL